jgi:hypothetical protein
MTDPVLVSVQIVAQFLARSSQTWVCISPSRGRVGTIAAPNCDDE